MSFVLGVVVPGLPQPLLVPEKNPGWQSVRDGFDAVRKRIEELDPDLLLVYSTMWPSVIGHQIQADPEPTWVHVDELFHDLGSIPYTFRIDADFAHAYQKAATARGLHARTVAYHGFPIDTGSVVALKLLNPDNAVPACIVSSNIYSDRTETAVLAKAARDAARGKRVVAIVVTSLSNRFFTEFIDPADDRIHSAKDEEWNQKLLEFLGNGRLEDVSQLSREIQKQIRIHKVVNFKPMWWLSGVMDRGNSFLGEVHAYAPIHGVGAGVVTLTPAAVGVGDKEYDEDDVETYQGDRHVLDGGGEASASVPSPPTQSPAPSDRTEDAEGRISTSSAPAPVGAYPHARRVGDLLFLSGIGPRTPGTDAIPGGPVKNVDGSPRDYDVTAQTEQVVANVKAILEASGSSLDKVLDVQVFLVDMDRDFGAFNAVYKKHFQSVGATRTTVAIDALPTPIAVEFKVIAAAG